MIVRALFFASYRDIAGTDELEIDIPSGSSVSDLVTALRASGGSWTGLPKEPAIAVNMNYTTLSTDLREGDEIAFIPPVSGG